MEWIKLIGIVIIVLGFVFKFNTIASVVLAGLATALVSGLSFMEFFTLLGESFINNRIVSIFFLTLPMIGLAESYGLKEQAVTLIQKVKGLTMGGFYTIYLGIRLIAGFFSIRIGGHPQFVRPIVQPMGEAAIKKQVDAENAEEVELSVDSDDQVKSLAAANENFGNFYGQNTFVGASGVLLIIGILNEQGYNITPAQIAQASIPIAIISLVVGAAYNFFMERRIAKREKGGRK